MLESQIFFLMSSKQPGFPPAFEWIILSLSSRGSGWLVFVYDEKKVQKNVIGITPLVK